MSVPDHAAANRRYVDGGPDLNFFDGEWGYVVDNKIQSTTFGSYQTGVWYPMLLVVDLGAKRWDWYLGDQSETDLAFSEGASSISKVSVSGGNSTDSTIYIDAIKANVLRNPVGLTVTGVTGDQISVAWTDTNARQDRSWPPRAAGHRVYVSTDGGITWTQDSGELPADAKSYTTTSLLDGEQYLLTVEAFRGGTTARDVESGADRATGEYGGQRYGRGRPPVVPTAAGEYGGNQYGDQTYGGS